MRVAIKQALTKLAVTFSVFRLAVIRIFVIAVVRRLTEPPFLGKYKKAKLSTFAPVRPTRAHVCIVVAIVEALPVWSRARDYCHA